MIRKEDFGPRRIDVIDLQEVSLEAFSSENPEPPLPPLTSDVKELLENMENHVTHAMCVAGDVSGLDKLLLEIHAISVNYEQRRNSRPADNNLVPFPSP